MIIIPAIDLKGGRCVRLAQGDFNRTTVYGEHPADVAGRWQDEGAERIHVVDLDGSLAGSPRNMEAIRDIICAVDIPVELGGGIRDMETIASYANLGVRWIILGTAALRNPELVQDACRTFADRIILGIDAHGAHNRHSILGNIKNGGNVFLGNYNHMHGSHGIYVVKGENLFIFVNFAARY